MTALAAARQTLQSGDGVAPSKLSLPQKGSTTIYAGSLVVLSAGYAAPASAATALVAVGRACETQTNSGSDGAVNITVEQGVFKWANGSAGDAIAQADVGAICYALDDQTVVKTDGNGARSPAGRIVGLDSGGVYVDTFIGVANGTAPGGVGVAQPSIVSFPVTLAQLANSAVAARFTPAFACRIKKTSFVTTAVVTTAAKLATLTPKIATVAVTGGVLALTSAGCSDLGEETAGTAVTAANECAAGAEITVEASAVTAFIEGEGVLLIHLG